MPAAELLAALEAWLAARGSSLLEAAGFATGALNVWLATRQRVLSWPVGIVNAAVYAVVFARAGLYSDTGLQLAYVALSVYGWIQWRRGGPGRTPLAVSRASGATLARLAVAGTAGWLALATVTSRIPGSSLPALDAALVAGSLVAQYMMTRKLRECWLLWIAVDVSYVALFVYKALWLTALLYALFTLLAVAGFRAWHTAWIRSTHSTAPGSSGSS
jgi:nicotinamide mononucleotide transporter